MIQPGAYVAKKPRNLMGATLYILGSKPGLNDSQLVAYFYCYPGAGSRTSLVDRVYVSSISERGFNADWMPRE